MKILFPREHGAWVMLYAPFLSTVITLRQFSIPVLLFFVAVTAFFFLHAPLFLLVRLNPAQPNSTSQYREARTWIAIYAAIAILAGVFLLLEYKLWLLLPAGAASALILLLQTYLTSRYSEKTIAGEFLAVAALTFSAPVVYYVMTKRFDSLAWQLWLFNMIYFISSVFYVKMIVGRVTNTEPRNSLVRQCAVYHIFMVIVIAGLVWLRQTSPLVGLAFLPIILRAFWNMAYPARKLSLKKVGVTEIAYTILFVVLLAFGLRSS